MEKTQFEMLYESVLAELNSLEEYENEIEPELKSFEEFKHFCKDLYIIAELDTEKLSDKMIECSLYFMKETDSENKPVRFDFYNQQNPTYYQQYREIFDKLIDYKKHFIVTKDGQKTSPKIIWG